MVDGIGSVRERIARRKPLAAANALAAAPSGWSLAVADEAALGGYAAFCEGAVHAAPQDPLFVSRWARETGADMLIASFGAGGRTLISLPLEIRREGPFKVSGLPGGSHANGNFPAVDEAFDCGAAPGFTDALAAALAAMRPAIDLLSLERLDPQREGKRNPLADGRARPSPNLALAADLEGGFEALLERMGGKRKKKKHRSQLRKFEEHGGFRLVRAGDAAEADRLLDAFFTMKRQRFARMGIADVFAGADIRAFFHGLFKDALAEARTRFVLDGLEVGGRLRAVAGSSVAGERITCEFAAIEEDELAHASPGDFLFFENIARACEEGFRIYDFGVGDEPYKRVWCDMETVHRDVLVPLTHKGRALALARGAAAAIKTTVKRSAPLWSAARRLRRLLIGSRPA